MKEKLETFENTDVKTVTPLSRDCRLVFDAMWLFALSFFAVHGLTLAGDFSQDSRPPSHNFNYDFDLRLTYIEPLKLGGPSTIMAQRMPLFQNGLSTGNSDASKSRQGFRALGLTKAAINLNFVHKDLTGVSLSLRPDSLRGGAADGFSHEFDSRSGDDFYRKNRASIQFLNTYNITYFAGRELAFSVGVFDVVDQSPVIFPSILQFGLLVLPPEKFFGGRVHWSSMNDQRLHPDATESSGWKLTLTAIQGQEDLSRVSTVKSDESLDLAPEMIDPFWGAIANARLILSENYELALLGGVDTIKEESGKRTESYWKFSTLSRLNIWSAKFLIYFDFRFSRVTWQIEGSKKADLKLQSTNLKFSYPLSNQLHLYTGLYLGRNEVHDEADRSRILPIQGNQVELGVDRSINEYMSVVLLAAIEERRKEDTNGDFKGAFVNSSGSNERIQRFGALINYWISQ